MAKYRLTRKDLLKKGVPLLLIPGILWASIFGLDALDKTKNYYQSKVVFPASGVAETIEDGDTFTLSSGAKVRMTGIDAPARGKDGYDSAKDYLTNLIEDKKVYLEYDRYQDDKYGRILAWVWLNCEQKPKFKSANYMHLSGNRSREGLMENPKGCQKGLLINEKMVDQDLAEIVSYQKRGELKYEKRLEEEK